MAIRTRPPITQPTIIQMFKLPLELELAADAARMPMIVVEINIQLNLILDKSKINTHQRIQTT